MPKRQQLIFEQLRKKEEIIVSECMAASSQGKARVQWIEWNDRSAEDKQVFLSQFENTTQKSSTDDDDVKEVERRNTKREKKNKKKKKKEKWKTSSPGCAQFAGTVHANRAIYIVMCGAVQRQTSFM